MRRWSCTSNRLWCHGIRGTYSTAEAGTRAACVQCVGPREQAALRLRYVRHAGGWYAHSTEALGRMCKLRWPLEEAAAVVRRREEARLAPAQLPLLHRLVEDTGECAQEVLAEEDAG